MNRATGWIVGAAAPLLAGAALAAVPLSKPSALPPDAPARRAGEPRSRLVAVCSMFRAADLTTLLAAGAKHSVFKSVPLYLGHYGVFAGHSEQIHSAANARYAPIFPAIDRTNPDRPRRKLKPSQEKLLGPDAEKYAGDIPRDLTQSAAVFQIARALSRLPRRERYRWGVEVGRRFRDEIRAGRQEGIAIESWQLDEIVSEAYRQDADGASLRLYQAGQVHGLTFGRPGLGDRPLRGFVFLARPEWFTAVPSSRDMDLLFTELERGSIRLLAEEYPVFRGSARAAAAAARASGEQRLRARGGTAARLAKRWAPTLTPGYRLYGPNGPTGLNGNVDRRSDAYVEQWRREYLAERVQRGVAGIGFYNFIEENARPRVIRGVVAAVARALKAR